MSGTDRGAELRRLLTEVPALRLRPGDWEEIDRLLAGIERGDLAGVEELSQVVFEARVRRRFHGGRSGAAVVPTKQTSVLPWVGLICGALLVTVGALLGGGVILVGIVGLGVFVFGIAWAGSRVAHRGADDAADPGQQPVPIPDAVAVRVNAMRHR